MEIEDIIRQKFREYVDKNGFLAKGHDKQIFEAGFRAALDFIKQED